MGMIVLGVGVAKDGSFSCITKNKTQATGGIKFGDWGGERRLCFLY